MDEPLIPQERAEQAPAAQQTAEPGKNLPPRPGGNPAPMSNIPGQPQQAPVNAWGGRPNPQGQYAPQQGGPSSFYSPEAQAGGQWGNLQGPPPGQQTQWSQSRGAYPTSPPIQEQGPLQQGWGPVPPQGPVSPQGSVPPQIHRQEQIYVNQGAGRGNRSISQFRAGMRCRRLLNIRRRRPLRISGARLTRDGSLCSSRRYRRPMRLRIGASAGHCLTHRRESIAASCFAAPATRSAGQSFPAFYY